MTNSNDRPYPGVPVIDADGHVLEPRRPVGQEAASKIQGPGDRDPLE